MRKSQEQIEQEEAAKIIRLATKIMSQGHYGWSWALAEAKKQIRGY